MIEDITLARMNANRPGVCIERAYTKTEAQYAWFRRIVCSEPNTAEVAKAAWTAGNWMFNRVAFWMRDTKNTEITDSTLDTISGIGLDFGGYARINPIDGLTSPFWNNPLPLASSGIANEPWLQVDGRTTDVIKAINIWPRLDANAQTADIYVTVSPTPFGNDLDVELARADVFSQFIPGKLTGFTTVTLLTALSDDVLLGYIGRYVRVWRFPINTTGALTLAEIEVIGCNARWLRDGSALACDN